MKGTAISETFIRKQSRVMLRYIFRWVRNWEDAREIVQECWLKFFTNHMEEKYAGEVPYEAVLFKILKFEACNFIRKKSRRRKKLIFNSEVLDRVHPCGRDPSHDKTLIFRDRRERILKQLENNGKVFNLMEYVTIKQILANRGNHEIARALQTSPETVSKKKYTAKMKLRALIKKEKKRKKLLGALS